MSITYLDYLARREHYWDLQSEAERERMPSTPHKSLFQALIGQLVTARRLASRAIEAAAGFAAVLRPPVLSRR